MNLSGMPAMAAVFLLVTTTCGCKGGAPASVSANKSPPVQVPSLERAIRLAPEAIRTLGLQTALASSGGLSRELVTTAVIKPNAYRVADVSPRVPGKAIEVYARLGDNVKKGAVLAKLDSLELGQAKAAFLRARADLDVAKRNYDRLKTLYAKQISSERDYLTAKGDFERSEAAYNQAREALRLLGLSEAQIAGTNWDSGGGRLSLLPLISPFSGTVISRDIVVGEQVRPDQTVFTIADLRVVWLLADIHEKDLARVRIGDPVGIQVDAYPGEEFRGSITYISDTIEPATRTASARVEIANPDRRLRLGMFARAHIKLRPAPGERAGIVIPTDAVQRVGEKFVVFIEQEPGTYFPRVVSLATASDDAVEVRSGLAAGERVVTKGAFYLKSVLVRESVAR